jgi:hypothetical protein
VFFYVTHNRIDKFGNASKSATSYTLVVKVTKESFDNIEQKQLAGMK